MSESGKFLEQLGEEEPGKKKPVMLSKVLELANQLSPEDQEKLVEALDPEAYYRKLVLEAEESIKQNGVKPAEQMFNRLKKKYKDMAEQQGKAQHK